MVEFPFSPMEPILTHQPFSDPSYAFQVKWDGVRMLVQKRGDDVLLVNRKGKNRTALYPDIANEVRKFKVHDCILDGEMISFGKDGKPDFRQILHRDLAKKPKLSVPVCFVAFDCVQHDGVWLLERALEDRYEVLEDVVSVPGLVQRTENFADGMELFQSMERMQMEGIVAKRKGSAYHPGGKSGEWQKVKCWRYTVAEGLFLKWRDERPNAVIVGTNNEPTNEVFGAVATGIPESEWGRLTAWSESGPEAVKGHPDWTRLRPGIQMKIRFLEWTDDGKLRAPVVQSISYPSL